MLQAVGSFLMFIIIGLIFTSKKQPDMTWKERGIEILSYIIGLVIMGGMLCGTYWIYNKFPVLSTIFLVGYLIFRYIQVHKKKDRR